MRILLSILLFVACCVKAQTVYTITGSGNMSSSSTWLAGATPPSGGGSNVVVSIVTLGNANVTNDLGNFTLLQIVGNTTYNTTFYTNNGAFVFTNNYGSAWGISNLSTGQIDISNVPIVENVNFTMSGNCEIDSVISGVGLIFSTAGTNLLTGANNFTGPTIYTGGITVSSSGNLTFANTLNGGVSYQAITNNGQFNWINTIQVMVNNISGTGSVFYGGGSYTLDQDNNSYTGGTTLSNISITGFNDMVPFGPANTLVSCVTNVFMQSFGVGVSNTISIYPGSTLTLNGIMTVYGPITNSGGILIDNAVELYGTNTFTGGVTFSAAPTLYIGGSGNLESGNYTNPLNLANGQLIMDTMYPQIFSGVVSGVGTFVQESLGNVTFTAKNTATVGITVTNGSSLIFSNSQWGLPAYLTNNGTVLYESSSGTTYTNSGYIAGAGTIIQSNASFNIFGTNTFTGTWKVLAPLIRTLQFLSSSAIMTNLSMLQLSSNTYVGNTTISNYMWSPIGLILTNTTAGTAPPRHRR